jgi:hypothetical protein
MPMSVEKIKGMKKRRRSKKIKIGGKVNSCSRAGFEIPVSVQITQCAKYKPMKSVSISWAWIFLSTRRTPSTSNFPQRKMCFSSIE